MSEKALYTVSHFAEKDGKFRGVVSGTDDRPVMWTDRTFETPEQAERNARGAFRRAIFECSHEWKFGEDEHAETTAWGGTDYVSYSDCKKCGLRRWWVDNRSVYDEPRIGW